MFYEKGGYKPVRCRNFETTGERCSDSELTNTIELFIVYVHRNEAHFTYI